MGEKRKTGWGRTSSSSSQMPGSGKEKENALPYRNVRLEKAPVRESARPTTQESFKESLFDAEANESRSPEKKVERVDRPSRFHEEVETPVEGSTKNWEETLPKKVDAGKRASQVAEAVEAATTTPITP